VSTLFSWAFISACAQAALLDSPEIDDRARATHRFQDAEKWADIWDHPSRDDWQEPGRIVEILRLEPGMSVADIGAGTGYFNATLSEAVGAEGVVYPVDVEESLVEHMRERADEEVTPNVRPVLGAADDPQLPIDRVDRILMVDTYHHIDQRISYFERVRELLAPDGLFVDVDWKPGRMDLGPAEEHKISPQQVKTELQRAGFELLESHELRYQYVLVFRPAR